MPFLFEIIVILIVISFWAAVASFIPTTFYLLLINPRIRKAQRLDKEYVSTREKKKRARKKSSLHTKITKGIYVACFTLVGALYVFKWIRFEQRGLSPFNFLFASTVTMFYAAILTYIPAYFFFRFKNPPFREEDEVCLGGIYIFYSVCMLNFAVFYVFQWLKNQDIFVDVVQVIMSSMIIFITSAGLSYLPILLYIFFRIANPRKQKKIHSNVIFVMYSICFLISSGVYIIQWNANRLPGRIQGLWPFLFGTYK